jgi:cupin 2 domain-containing protein
MTIARGNIFDGVPRSIPAEEIVTLASSPDVQIERIVSTGHASPPGEWYDQDRAEFVVLLEGAAGLLFEGEAKIRVMRRGDFLRIPPHARHRVEWTAPDRPTIWLAIHHR